MFSLARLFSRLIPPRCELCLGTATNAIAICDQCKQYLHPNRKACICCALPLTAGYSFPKCAACMQKPAPYPIWSAYLYREPLPNLLAAFKYQQKIAYGNLLAKLMVEQLSLSSNHKPDLIIPIPLHHKRLAKRGFNQSEVLAAACARFLQVPLMTKCLIRHKNTLSQTDLKFRQRRQNLRNCFSLKRKLPARDVVLIDDVVTSTATCNSAAKVLLQGGAQRVRVWSLLRANPDYSTQ